MRRKNSVGHGGWVRIIISIMLVILLCDELASARFLVQPMIIQLALERGKQAVTEIRLENTGAVRAETIDLQILELTQIDDAKWQPIMPDSDFDTSKLSSCSKWISIGRTSVQVPPLTNVPLPLSITVPHGARGFYYASILADIRQPEDIVGIGLKLRFVIPILVQVEGRPMRHRVGLSDVGMEFAEATGQRPATTLVSLKIANNGGTYSRLGGMLRVDGLFDEHYRQITTAEFDQVGIIPGVEFTLRHDINRTLPSGKYRLTGVLLVDGRRVEPLTKEIDFAGDPRNPTASVDAALVLDPAELVMESVPGASRTTTTTVYNTSDEAVNVTVVPTIPPHLKHVARGPDLKGPDLDCSAWVNVQPEQFTLSAGANQSIRITTKMPNPGNMHAYYYSLLKMQATYPDGQNAGITRGYVMVANKRVETKYSAVTTREPTLGAMEGSKYVVVSQFGNIGNVHFKPMCMATVTKLQGGTMAKKLLSGQLHSMLPLEMRDFSGVIDFSEIPADTYRLSIVFEYAPGEAVRAIKPILVSVQDNRKVVEILSEEELKKIGIKW